MTEPERRLRSDAAEDARGPRRRRVGHQRPQVVLELQRLDRRLPDRHGGHRPRCAPAPARLDVHRPDRHAGREHHARRADDGAPGADLRPATATTPRSSTRTCACRPTRCSAREGAGFLIAQQRLGPGRIHHCMRWLGVSPARVRHALRARDLPLRGGSPLADKQTVQNWIADSAAQMQAARLMTLHAAWVMDTQGVSAARKRHPLIKFFGAQVMHDVIDRALQAHGSLGLLDRPAARGDVPLRARRALLRRSRRGAPPVGRAADPARLRAARRTGCRPSTCRPAGRRRASGSRTCSTRSRATIERAGSRSSSRSRSRCCSARG